MIFGAERFEHLIGQLRIATMAMGEYELTKDEDEKIQARRVTRAAVKMAAMLQTFVDGDKEGFDRQCRNQAQLLKETAFGAIMLHTLGHAYINFTRQQAGNVVSSSIASLAQKRHRLGTFELTVQRVSCAPRPRNGSMAARDVHDNAQVRHARIPVRPPWRGTLAWGGGP